MQFDQLTGREFVTLLGGWALATCAALLAVMMSHLRTKHRSDIQIAVRRIPLSGAVDHFLRHRSLRLIRHVTRPRRWSSTSTTISRCRTRRQFSNLTLMGPDQRSTPFRLTRQPKENIIPAT
jgi:hypothetical protein